MKKLMVIVMVCMFATVTFAHGPRHRGNSGVRLAADIINLVDSGLRVLTGQPQTVIVNQPAALVAQPIVYPQQQVIYQQPTVVYTQPQTVVVNQYQNRYYRKPAPPRKPMPINRKPQKNNHRGKRR